MTGRWWRSLLLVASLAAVATAAPVGAQSPGASEAPTASATPTPSEEPGADPVGMPWVTSLPAVAAGEGPDPQPWAVTAWSGGFAMLEGRHNGWVRLSADGSSWSDRIDVGRPVAGTGAIAPYGEGLIAVGRRSEDLVAWTSADGKRWRPMNGSPIFDGTEVGNLTAYVQRLETVGDRTLLQGVVACPESICQEAGPRLWGLTRGGRWERLPLRIDAGRIVDVFAGRDRFLATVETGADATADLLVASRDGRSWRRVGTLGPDAANRRVQVGEAGAGFVLVEPDQAAGTLTLLSPDGTTRTTTSVPPAPTDVLWWLIVVDGDTVMVPGYSPSAGPLAVVSTDGGATWALSAGWPDTADGCFRGGAVRGATAVTVGECGDAARAWVAAIPGVTVTVPAVSLTGPIDPADVPFAYGCHGIGFTAQDVAGAPLLSGVDPEGLASVLRIAPRAGIGELEWRRVASNGVRTLAFGRTPDGATDAAMVYGRGGVFIYAASGGACAQPVGSSAIRRVALDPTKPGPTRTSRVLHLRTTGCSDPTLYPTRIAWLRGHLLLRIPLAPSRTGRDSEVGCSDTVRFDVRLPQPLGDRRIWNAANLPLTELTR